MTTKTDGVPEEFLYQDPETGEVLIDHDRLNAYVEETRRQERRQALKSGITRAVRSPSNRRTATYFWRNRRRVGRASRLYAGAARKAVVKKIAAKGAVKVGAKLLATGLTSGWGAVLFIPDLISLAKSKPVKNTLFFIVGLMLIPVFFVFLLIAFLMAALKQYGGGEGSYNESVLTISKTTPTSSIPNPVEGEPSEVAYTLEITNNSYEEMTSVSVTDPMMGSSECTFEGGALQPGETGVCTYTVAVNSESSDSLLTNTAIVRGVYQNNEELVRFAVSNLAVGTPTNTSNPCGYPMDNPRITQGCNPNHATVNITGKGNAVDFGGAEGVTPILATISGTAQRCSDKNIQRSAYGSASYGNYVLISNGEYETRSAHLYSDKGPGVRSGGDVANTCGEPFAVEKGDIIGYLGTTGNSTGPHLHYEIKDLANNALLCPTNGILEGTAAICVEEPTEAAVEGTPSPAVEVAN